MTMKYSLYHRIVGNVRGHCLALLLITTAIFAWPIILLGRRYPKVHKLYHPVLFFLGETIVGDYFLFYHSSLLDELHQIRKEKGQPLTIVEIGPGNGTNLDYYPSDTNLIIIEKNQEYTKKFQEKLKKFHPKIKVVKEIMSDVTDLTPDDIADSSADIVVGTRIFCCIRKDLLTGEQIKRILKPDGKFFSLEFVQREPSTQDWKEKILRSVFRPLFTFVGCRINIQLPQAIFLKKLGFDVSRMKTVDCPCLPTYFSTVTYGVAVNS